MNGLIIFLLGLSTLLQVCDMLGFIPNFIRKRFKMNKAADTIDVLRELGVDIDTCRRANTAASIPVFFSSESIEDETRKQLKKTMIKKHVSVGKTRGVDVNYYIDLMGYSCKPEVASAYARLLSTFWQKVVSRKMTATTAYDFVITPKSGSPILGYEFSKIVKKPLVLFEDEPRFVDGDNDVKKWFDCASVPANGTRAIIVDDSTTGGRKVVDIITRLREYGYEVSDCLVVFEPKCKDAAAKLQAHGVKLFSIVKTHDEN